MKSSTTKYKLQIAKLILQGVCLLFLVTITLFAGIIMSRTNIDLTKTQHANGIVDFIKQPPNKNGRSNLTIQLRSDTRQFSLYRYSQDYKSLIDTISNQNITIYFDANSTSLNHEIYQISIQNAKVYSKEEYERQEKFAGNYIAIPAGILMLILCLYDIIKRYKKLAM